MPTFSYSFVALSTLYFYYFFFCQRVYTYKSLSLHKRLPCSVLLVDKPGFASLKGLLLFCPIRTTNIAGLLAEDAIG